jgi:hypothetical protein
VDQGEEGVRGEACGALGPPREGAAVRAGADADDDEGNKKLLRAAAVWRLRPGQVVWGSGWAKVGAWVGVGGSGGVDRAIATGVAHAVWCTAAVCGAMVQGWRGGVL